MSDARTTALVLDLVKHPDAHGLLYHHQAVVLDEWDRHEMLLVETKTGTGKTTAAMLPILKRRAPAVAVYPTNELLRDQVSSIRDLAAREDVSISVVTPDEAQADPDAEILLVPIDGDMLADWCRKLRYRTKGDALQALLHGDKPRIILTNPDVLFLIFSLGYRAEALAALQRYQVLVVDEFHLYTGVELAHALMMVHLARSLNTFTKVVLLSATPDPEVRRLLDRLFRPHVVGMGARSRYEVVGQRTAMHPVQLVPVLAGLDIVETAAKEVRARAAELRALRSARPDGGYLPALVVLNSVVNAIHLEDELVERETCQHDEMAIIRGLSSREVRRPAGKLLAIGTAAVEVGIDFHCDCLIFEASEAASFMQRFGRVGRHEPGTAVILCPPNVIKGLESLNGEVSRADLEERVYAWYSERQAYAWFAETYGGLVTTRSLVESVLMRVREDRRATPEQVSAAADALCSFWRSYAEALEASPGLIGRVERHFARMDSRYPWLRAYTELNTFRTSLPSEWVHDFAEGERRGDHALGDYRADIATLLRRAEGLRYSEEWWNNHVYPSEQGMLTVRGYGRWRRVGVTPWFPGLLDGEFSTTGEGDGKDLRFVQDPSGHRTSVSHVMTLRPHVFTLLPKSLRPKLDWRLPVFDCGDRLIAFDGAALLAKEVWQRAGRDP